MNKESGDILELLSRCEKVLIVQTLKEAGGSLSKDLLWETVHAHQGDKWKRIWRPHSKSNFNYWIKQLEKFAIIEEQNHEVSLTDIGQWVSRSNGISIEQRIDFASWIICKRCRSLLKPEEGTVRIYGSDLYIKQLAVNTICPKCNDKSQLFIPVAESESELWRLHDDFIMVLWKIFSLK